MSGVIDQPKEAEIVADEWAHANFRDVMDVSYGLTVKHGQNWLVRGQVEIQETLLGTKRVPFEMEISVEGEILEVKQG